jgi:hypothetical protein
MEDRQNVVVTDIHIPFGSMITFMVKWAIASIPAAIILFLIYLALGALFSGCAVGLGKLTG